MSLSKVEQAIARITANNGIIDAGIAAGGDKSLPEKFKIAIMKSPGNTAKAIAHAYSHIDPTFAASVYWSDRIFASLCILFSGDFVTRAVDDRKMTDETGLQSFNRDISDTVLSEAGTIILATKLNLWSTNHHTGQGALTGYAKKVYQVMFASQEPSADTACQVFHMIGHWADTGKVWAVLGIKGCVLPRGWAQKINLRPASDVTLRASGPPAGTGKVFLAIAILRKAVHHALYPLIHNAAEVKALIDLRDTINADPIAYHEGAKYFANKDRIRVDCSEFSPLYAKLIIFIKIIYSRSTLAKSPSIPRELVDLDDYDDNFKNACIAFTTKAAAASNKTVEDLIAGTGIIAGQVTDEEKKAISDRL